MKDRERIVRLEPCEGGAVIAIAGTDSKFTVLLRSMWLTASQLELRTSYDRGPTSYLVGKCELDKHDSISIIGYPDARATELNLTIHGGDVGEIADTEDSKSGPYTAAIGYMEQDRELGIQSGFFLELTVSHRTLEHLIQCIAHDRFKSLRIGVKSDEIYNDAADRYSWLSMRVTWYLRPQKDTGRTDFPETANGRLSGLVLLQKSVDGRPADDPGVREDEQTRGSNSEYAPAARHVGPLHDAAQADALRSIAKSLAALPWVIGAVAFVLLLN